MTNRMLLPLLQGIFVFWRTATADVVLDRKTMHLTLTAAELSTLAYVIDPPSEGYDMLKSFNEEPDQALVAKKYGYCYGVFRGTTLTLDDWSQNFVLHTEEVCGSDNMALITADADTKDNGDAPPPSKEPPVCCAVRAGFYDAYHTSYYQDFEKALRHCAQDCLDPDECVVLTGHSQGGAVAAVAAITMVDLNPYVVTFGQPPTLAPGCPFLTSERWYRWVNTRVDSNLGITYDPVPFSPGVGTECWGHFLVLGEESDGVAYMGLDSHMTLLPVDPVAGAHTMKASNDTTVVGYWGRIASLIEYNKNVSMNKLEGTADETLSTPSDSDSPPEQKKVFSRPAMVPIPTDGFRNGALCSQNTECMSGVCDKDTGLSWKRCFGFECKADADCETNRCDNGECAPKLGSCQPCDENSDCKSGKCLGFQCTGAGQLMDENCGCFINSDCRSGRCEGVNPRTCEAVLPMDARCTEDSDCMSGYCSWSLRCADPSLKQNEIEVESFLWSWKSLVVLAAVIVLYYVGKYAIEWYFDTEYETIPDNNNAP